MTFEQLHDCHAGDEGISCYSDFHSLRFDQHRSRREAKAERAINAIVVSALGRDEPLRRELLLARWQGQAFEQN